MNSWKDAAFRFLNMGKQIVFDSVLQSCFFISEMKSLENSHEPYVIALERIDQSHVKYALLLHQYESWSDYETIEVSLDPYRWSSFSLTSWVMQFFCLRYNLNFPSRTFYLGSNCCLLTRLKSIISLMRNRRVWCPE